MKYRSEIDGLRAIAVISVILFHVGISTFFSGGYVGVDIFFVISGYLITSIILAEIRSGKFSLYNFYERRARRILPALFFVMALSIPFAWFLLAPKDMISFSKSLIATPLFLSNVFFWSESGYFDNSSVIKPLIHTWSLAIEEQFYIFFPILFIKIGKNIIILLVIFISLFLAQYGAENHPSFTFYWLPTRIFEFLIGALISINFDRIVIKNHSTKSLLSFVGLFLILTSIFIFDKNTLYPSVYTLIPTVGAGLIILFADQNNFLGKILSYKLFVRLGLISYSAYLWHQPIIAFFRHTTEDSIFIKLICIITPFLLANLSWRYVETPFRKSYNINILKLYITGGLILFFVFGFIGVKSNGYLGRPGMDRYNVFNESFDNLGYQKCDIKYFSINEKINYCYQENNKLINAVVVGDSHAADKFYGIQKNISNFNWALLGNSGCPPTLNIDVRGSEQNCRAKFDDIVNSVVEQSQIQIVVLSFFGSYPLTEPFAADLTGNNFGPDSVVEISSKNINSKSRDEIFYFGLSETISKLIRANKKVYLLIDVPELPFSPINCVKGFGKCSIPLNETLIRQSKHRELIKRLALKYPELIVFDPIDIFCTSEICSYENNGIILYKDSTHLTLQGSDIYGNRLKHIFK